jgi:hypothetical protein
MSDGHPEFADAMYDQPTAMNSEPSVTVRHEDLQVVKQLTPQCPEVFSRQRTDTNVMAGYI